MRKGMSHSDAGRLGGKKSQFLKNKTKYEECPKLCKNCKSSLPYEKRRNIFCHKSCAASYNNCGVRRHGNNIIKPCVNCGRDTKNPKFCSNSCQQKDRQRKTYDLIKTGKYNLTWSGNPVLKNFLIEERGFRCEQCQNSEWQGEKIPLNVHHIDGNAKNNAPNNLQLLCLNCHGLTKNFGGLNKGKSTRTYRYKASSEN